MNSQNLRKTLYDFWRRRGITVFTAAAVLCTCLAATDWAGALCILTGVEDAAIVLDGTGTAPDLSSKLIYTADGSRGYDVFLNYGQSVAVRYGGSIRTTTSRRESISRLLRRLHIEPSPLEMVGVNFTRDGVELTVSSELTYYDYALEDAPHTTVRRPNASMTEGEEKVVQEGADGVRSSVYEVVWSNGRELSRQFVEELDSTAVDEIVEYGTAAPPAPEEHTAVLPSNSPIASVSTNADGSGVLTLQSGETLRFSSVKSMTATAYTAGYDGADYCTATGTTVRVGVVAVDKRVIPLGTRMYIVTNDGIVYGTAVAEDTGVRGNKVDLYFNTYDECINFGRRGCSVYILQ